MIDVGHSNKQIYNAIKKQIKHGKFKSEKIYGSGNSGEKISKILENYKFKNQKRITF